MMPPAQMLLTQTLLLLLTRNEAAYCSAPVRQGCCQLLLAGQLWTCTGCMLLLAAATAGAAQPSQISHLCSPLLPECLHDWPGSSLPPPSSLPTQLLVHPLVRQRSVLVAAILEYATLPILLLPVRPAGADFASLVAASQSGESRWGSKCCTAGSTGMGSG